ncbi:hypothetical protein C8F04DRAFT_1098703 [Mycena alexandri]|uniref:Uncharacterized protein n=1 Tax=Mycena alexandri TaxID=1745969 RepID=A0AAD6X539_9AGAR|nr:hypothetical protein C8F04DRAFT_1098703 [Mycena alexandri]
MSSSPPAHNPLIHTATPPCSPSTRHRRRSPFACCHFPSPRPHSAATLHFTAYFYLKTKPHLCLSAEADSKTRRPMLSPSRLIPSFVYSIPLTLPPPRPIPLRARFVRSRCVFIHTFLLFFFAPLRVICRLLSHLDRLSLTPINPQLTTTVRTTSRMSGTRSACSPSRTIRSLPSPVPRVTSVHYPCRSKPPLATQHDARPQQPAP